MNGVIGVATIVMIAVICLQTFARVALYSIPWSEELSRYLFCSVIILGISVGIGDDSFVRMDILDDKFKPRAKFVMLIIRDVVMILVCTLTFINSFSLIKLGAFRKSPSMQIPMNYVYLVVLVGFAIATFCAVVRTIEDVVKRIKEG